MTEQRKFKGIWIPAEMWLTKELTMQEKIMLVEIDSLSADPERGCFKRNKAFAEFFGLSESRVSEIISSIEKKGYVRLSFKRKGKQIVERNIFMTDKFFGIGEEPPSENADNPLRDPEEPSSGLAIESNTKRVIQEERNNDDDAYVTSPDDPLFDVGQPKPTRFKIALDWRPDQSVLVRYCNNAGCQIVNRPDWLMSDIIGEWVNYWHAEGSTKGESQWYAKLSGWIKRKLADHDSQPAKRTRKSGEPGKTDYRSDTCGMELAN